MARRWSAPSGMIAARGRRHHVRVGGDVAQAGRRRHLPERQLAARLGHVHRADIAAHHQLHQAHVGAPSQLLAQVFQICHFEGLDFDRCAARVFVRQHGRQETVFQRQARIAEVGRAFQLGHEADDASAGGRLRCNKIDDFFPRGDLELSIVQGVAGTYFRQSFDGAQGFQFGQGEVVDEPAFVPFAVDHLLAAPAGKFGTARHVGGVDQVAFMARHEDAVARGDQVRLDVVGAVERWPWRTTPSVCSGRRALAPRWANTSGRAGGVASRPAAKPGAAASARPPAAARTKLRREKCRCGKIGVRIRSPPSR